MGTSNAGGTPPPIVGPPLGSEDGIPVKQVGEINVVATPATQVTAAPSEGTPAEAVYVAGTADVKDETARTHLAAIRSQTDELEANTDQVETKLDTAIALLTALVAGFTPRPTFDVNAFNIAPGNGKSMISIAYGSAGDKTVVLREIVIANSQLSNITGQIIEFHLHKFTTHSGGTSLTPLARDSADTLDPNITARSGATVAGDVLTEYAHWHIGSDEFATGALETESIQASLINHLQLIRRADPQTKPYMLRPGEGFHIVCNTNTTAGNFDLSFVFSQEPS